MALVVTIRYPSLSRGHHNPVFEEKLFASAKVVHRGRTVGLVECDITTEDGKLVARAVSTCSVLRGEKAEGR